MLSYEITEISGPQFFDCRLFQGRIEMFFQLGADIVIISVLMADFLHMSSGFAFLMYECPNNISSINSKAG